METWRRFRALSAADRSLVLEAAAILLAVRTLLVTTSFLSARRWIRRIAATLAAPEDRSAASVRRLSWAVERAGLYVPGRATCLVIAMTGEAMCARRLWPCELRFGVERTSAPDGLDAHSWLELDGAVLLGATDDGRRYQTLSRPAVE